ncbi:MAG: hypothetical protein AAF960_11820 [Bacteroidota bacterium]
MATTNILHRTPATIIVALSDTTVGKVILPNPLVWVNVQTGERADFLNEEATSVEREALLLQYANAVNDLFPQYIGQQDWLDEPTNTAYPMLVMERLFPLPIHHFELSVRQQMFQTFKAQFQALHDHSFVHGDFMRPTSPLNRGDREWMFANIVQTATGLRMVDVGSARIYRKGDAELFVRILLRERSEIDFFGAYYLGDG